MLAVGERDAAAGAGHAEGGWPAHIVFRLAEEVGVALRDRVPEDAIAAAGV
jgi:hypothetical protein